MKKGKVVAIFIAPVRGESMEEVETVRALVGQGLEGDRYASGEGSWNGGRQGTRQVPFINAAFFPGSGFTFADSRRNVVTEGVELMALIGKRFMVGDVLFQGVRYCDPCGRPSKLAGSETPFDVAFHDRGGLIADVVESDGREIKKGDVVRLVKEEAS